MIKVILITSLVIGAWCGGDTQKESPDLTFPEYTISYENTRTWLRMQRYEEGIVFYRWRMVPHTTFTLHTSKGDFLLKEFRFEFKENETHLLIRFKNKTYKTPLLDIRAKVIRSSEPDTPRNALWVQPINMRDIQKLMEDEDTRIKTIWRTTDWLSEVLQLHHPLNTVHETEAGRAYEYLSPPLVIDDNVLDELLVKGSVDLLAKTHYMIGTTPVRLIPFHLEQDDLLQINKR